jgi:pyroglutamyl-peptidase
MHKSILLTGFAPFGGERSNPSWEVAQRFDRTQIGDVTVTAMRLPVNCARASRMVAQAIAKIRPVAFIGLGQAGGRPALSLEKVALNLADNRAGREHDGTRTRPIVPGGPDAYFSRLPITAILSRLARAGIPAALSLSAGVYVCNAVMYTALHAMRKQPRISAGFIHLPYTAAQATRHRAVASMTVDMMAEGVRLALEVTMRPSRARKRTR